MKTLHYYFLAIKTRKPFQISVLEKGVINEDKFLFTITIML